MTLCCKWAWWHVCNYVDVQHAVSDLAKADQPTMCSDSSGACSLALLHSNMPFNEHFVRSLQLWILVPDAGNLQPT